MATRDQIAELTPDARSCYLDHQLGIAANAMCEIAKTVAVAENCDDHLADGVDTMAAILMARGVAPYNAYDLVRVGHTLAALPETEAAFSDGEFTFDQLRPLTKFLTPETDKSAVDNYAHKSAAALSREAARHSLPLKAADAVSQHERRRLHAWTDKATGMFKLMFQCPPEDGAGVYATLLRIANSDDQDPDIAKRDPLHQRLADALIQMCATWDPQENPAGSDRGCVSIHIDADLLLDHYDTDTGLCDLDLPVSTRLAKETVERYLCDCMTEAIYRDYDGRIVGIDEARRTIPPKLFRQLHLRDNGACRWPGCNRRHYLQGHHIVWVEHDGPTQLDNLALVCWSHHRNLHEGKYTITGHPDHELTFRRPDGTPITNKPTRLDPELKRKLE